MLRDTLNGALKDAMRAKDVTALSTIRMILAAVKDADIAARSKGNRDGIPEDEMLAVLGRMVKQRRESITLYQQGGRQDLVDKENAEIGVIERFLPQQLDAAGMEAAIAKGIEATGATSLKELGQVMGWLKANYAGQLDFAKASQQAKKTLGG